MELATKHVFQEKSNPYIDHLLMGVLAAAVLGLCAPLRLYLPFSPIPFVMQNSLILFFAALLGRKAALTMIVAFLAQGAMGMPVFASGFIGLAAFVGPTGGYLVGYAVAAYIVGALFERRTEKTPLGLFCDLSIGGFTILFFGTLYLSTIVGSLERAFVVGFLPYVIPDMIKIGVLTTLAFGLTKKKSAVI